MILMGAGFLALAFTHDLDSAAMWFAMFAAVLGVGNGLSSGILLTLGADVAPKSDPAPFLGSWRTLTDAGGAVAPLLVSAIAAASSLAVATGAMGVLGLRRRGGIRALGAAVRAAQVVPDAARLRAARASAQRRAARRGRLERDPVGDEEREDGRMPRPGDGDPRRDTVGRPRRHQDRVSPDARRAGHRPGRGQPSDSSSARASPSTTESVKPSAPASAAASASPSRRFCARYRLVASTQTSTVTIARIA